MLRAALVLACALLAATPAVGQARTEPSRYADQQGWFTPDKALHFGVSAGGSAGLYAAGVELGIARWQAAAGSATVVAMAGVWREIGTTRPDAPLTWEHFSRRDLVWDAVGIVVGLGTTELYYRARDRRRDRARAPTLAPR